MVDQNALRTIQMLIVATVAIAFLLGSERGAWRIAHLAVCMAIGLLSPRKGPVQLLYRKGLVPAGIVKPNRETGSAAPHPVRADDGVVCLALAALLLILGIDIAGWVLRFIVRALVNLLFGCCTGCFVYLQLGRIRQTAQASWTSSSFSRRFSSG